MGSGPARHDAVWGRRAAAVFDAALDAVVCVDAAGVVTARNEATAQLLGWALGERLPEPLAAEVARARSVPRRVERAVTGRGGAELVVEASIVADADAATVLFVRDLTAKRRDERLRDVEHRVARLLVGARTGADVGRAALELVATGLGFDHAELWMPDDHRAMLRLAAAWRRERGTPFADAARHVVLGRGEDLAGLAWQAGEPLVWDDVAALDGLVRSAEIAAEGIAGAAALPVFVGERLAGVGVFARRDPAPLDAPLRHTLQAIAVQVRGFAERRAAERRLAEETVALAAVARATRRLTEVVDVGEARAAVCDAALEVTGGAVAFLATPDPEHGGLVVRSVAPAGAAGEDVDRHFPADAPSRVVRAFATRQAVFVGDVAEDPEADVERARQTGVVSALLQPILHEGEALGVIGIGWASRQVTLDRSTRLLVRLLAGEVALALARADLVARLEAAARTDPLTGLANRRGWEEHVARELASARRDGRPVAVALLDIDAFKGINDRLGHQGGDRVLRASAAAWRDQLREGDVLARLGGDEFAALLPGCEPDHAVALAERLRAATAEATTSVGVAYWDGEEDPAALMRRADAALYAAKAEGRDRVTSR